MIDGAAPATIGVLAGTAAASVLFAKTAAIRTARRRARDTDNNRSSAVTIAYCATGHNIANANRLANRYNLAVSHCVRCGTRSQIQGATNDRGNRSAHR